PDGANRRRVLLEFRTRDAFVFSPNVPKGFGHIESLFLEFDNTVPIIGTPVILQGSPSDIGAGNIETALGDYFDFAGGSSISGFVTMRIVVQAPAGLRHIRLRSGDDNIDLLAASNNPGFNNIEPWLSAVRPFQSDGDEYTLFIPINTAVLDSSPDATRFGSGFPLLTFPFPLELQLADNTDPSPFMAQNNYILRIDNRHPLGRYTGSLTAINHLHTIAGQASDHGPGVTVQGIDRVVVFFSRTDGLFDGFGTPLTSNGTPSNPSAVGWRTDMNVLEDHEGTVAGITQQGTPRVLPFFPTNFDLGGTGIQVNLEGAGAFSGSLGSPPLHNWHISNFDFSNFADGLLYVNYVIIDRAGNATFYREEIFLAVNRPVIRAVELGTTIGLGTTFSARNLPHGPLDPVDSNFRVRNNNFTLRLDVTNPLGVPITGALSYDIAHVTRVSNTPIPASQMEAGRVYRIAYRGTSIGLGAVDWVNYGVLVDLSVPVDGTLINPEGITFVATRNGSPANDGLVYEYEVPAVGPRRQVNTWTPATQINFGSTSFGSAPTLISDSVKVMPPEGAGVNYAFQNDRYFLVRVSNTATTPHITSAALVRVDVHNIDSRPPVLNIADFGYRAVGSIGNTPIQNFADRDILRLGETAAEYNMNIVMAPNGERRGYVQYHWHGDTPRADVSGRIIFRGMAADNNRITGMSVTIGGVTTQLATWGTDGLVREASLGSVQAMGNDGSTDQFGFDVSYQTNTLNFNHVFNWELAWDSSRLTGMVGNNVPIIFTVTDGVQNTPQTINVNVVPYITEISTPLSAAFAVNPSAFNRSARGWYPVRENDLITIRGFNLGGVGATPAVTLAGTNLFMGTSTSTQILANIGETAQSGPLVVTINGIQSLNNRSNNAAHYNREPNNLNNNLLTNARYMYVWQTGFLLNAPVLDNPVMQMRYDGTWNLAYARFHHGPIGTGLGTINAGQVRIMRSLGTAANATAAITDTVVRQGGQRYVHIGLATDGFGDWFVAASNIASPIDGLQNFVIHTREETGILNTAPAQSNFHGLRHRNLIRLTGDPERIRAPSVFAQTPGNGTAQGSIAAASRVLVGYFDTVGNNNALFFRYGLIGGTNAEISATAGFGGNFPNNPSPPNSNDNFDPVTHLFTPFIAGEDAGRPQVVAHSGTTHQGSQHVAVGALGNGLPVIAWFDRVNQTLVFSHGNSAPTTTQLDLATSISVTSTADWQNNARIIHYGAGSHVSMAIDGNNVVHIAYHDAVNGGLMYARIYPTGSGTSLMPDMSRIYVARVDTFLSAGIRLTIDVRRETHGTSTFYVPYISYFHNTFAETRNPIRVAWLRPDSSGGMSIRHGTFGGNLPLGSTANLTPGSIAAAAFPEHSFTGEWEIMTVPAYHVPTAVDFVGIGVPRTGRFFAPTNSGQAPNNVSNLARAGSFATTLTALHRSVLVGYMTLNNFEGAVLKYSIWD
ncbi:MAG: hypothetical protein FWC97_07515, partial [Treponema sp.]|nr:hypothetical protein [Treponema sp.]